MALLRDCLMQLRRLEEADDSRSRPEPPTLPRRAIDIPPLASRRSFAVTALHDGHLELARRDFMNAQGRPCEPGSGAAFPLDVMPS